MFKDKASDLFDELTVVQAAWDDPDPERSALRAFYDAAEGGGWTHRENWCSDKPLGEWYGVETDAEGHVTALRLAKNNLAGTVSWEIAKLTKLRHLDLSWNALEGPISVNDGKGHSITCLDDLIELETIDLSHNCIEGGYLPDWAKLNRLQYINLSFNKITSWVATWAHLFQSGRPIDLILNNNYLYGKIPDVIQKPSSVEPHRPPVYPGKTTVNSVEYHTARISTFRTSPLRTCATVRRAASARCTAATSGR